jgi:hypothetical protein
MVDRKALMPIRHPLNRLKVIYFYTPPNQADSNFLTRKWLTDYQRIVKPNSF